MVGAGDVLVDFGFLHSREEAFRYAEVVDAPADVAGACAAAEAPPGVLVPRIGVQAAEGVGKAAAQQGGEVRALFI